MLPTRVLEKVLGLRRGDLDRGLLLFAYLFLVISTYVVGQVARKALFLGRFPAVKLPLVDIACVLLVGAVAAFYIRAGRRLALHRLIRASLLLFALLGVLLWWLTRLQLGGWPVAAVYVWVGVFGVLAPAQVWTLANYLLSPREAKRLFGLLGGGATSGAIIGGSAAGLLVRRMEVEGLLLVTAAGLALAAFSAEAAWRRRPAALGAEPDERPASPDGPRGLRESFALVLESPALRIIAGLILVSSFATSIAAWQFYATAQSTLVSKEALATFFGGFEATVGALSLVVQAFVTPRLLRRFELGTVLLILPFTLVAGSSALLLTGTLAAAVAMRLGDKVLRYAVDRPAVELLYLPFPARLKVPVKSFIDTVIWRLGDGLAGVVVLAAATIGGLGARRMSLITLSLLVVWLALAFFSRGRYVEMLREAIRQHRLDAEQASAPALDRSATEILASRLDAVDPKEILYALDLFTVGQAPAHHPAVRGLLRHPAGEVRQRALQILSAAGDRSVVGEVERLLGDDHPGVRTEALLYLARHSDVDPVARLQDPGEFPDYSVRAAIVARLVRPGGENVEVARLLLQTMAAEPGPEGARARLEAARLGAVLPEPLTEPLGRLILDPDPDVARAAIAAVTRLDPRPFLEALLERLGDPRLTEEAASALVAAGELALERLRTALAGSSTAPEVRRRIPAVLARVGTEGSARLLAEHLLEPDAALRLAVITALNTLRRDNPALRLDGELMETALAAEVMGHYRSCQILERLGGEDADDPASQGLRDAMRREVERIFRLLALLFPGHDFHSAHVGLETGNAIIRGQSLDFLESILRPGMRRLLLPLVDPEVSLADRAQMGERVVGAVVGQKEEAIAALAASQDPWLRACAAYAIGALGLRELGSSLDAWAEDPDPLLRETVRQAKERLSGGTAQG